MKFLDLLGLSEFLDNLKEIFPQFGHKHTISDLTDYNVDASFSSTSTNPIQNKVVNNALLTIANDIDSIEQNADKLNDEFDSHIADNTAHMTSAQKTQLSDAYTHSTSAHARVDATKVEKSTTNGNILINGTQTVVYTHPSGTNPHGTTRADIGLGNVDNTSDMNKPVSTAQRAAIDAVQTNVNTVDDKIDDHTNNADIHFTAAERTKLSGIATGANKYTHPTSGVTAGTYKSVTVDVNGHVTGGTNPTTLSGYGITDAEAKGTVNSHNTSTSAHNDIRLLVSDISTKLNNFLNVNDTTKDQLSEIIALIEDNADDIESITSGKVNVSDIVNNLTTNVSNKPLSAAQGVAIKSLIDELQSSLNTDIANLSTHTGNTTIHITSTERTNWNDAHSKRHEHSNKSVLDNTTASYTTAEKTKLSGIEEGATNTIDWFENGISIPSGSDLNTYTTSGKYYCETVALSKTMVNSPVESDNFCLYVFKRTTGSSINQLIYTLGGLMYMRGSDSSGSFRAWKGVATSDNINAIIEEIGILADLTTTEKTTLVSAINELKSAVTTAQSTASTAKTTADSKVGSVSLASGTNNGTLKLTVDGKATDNIAVKGLGSAAYTASDSYAPSEHTHNYAGSSSAGGAATSANKLNTNAGSATQPVYFADGIPKATTYTLGKSVPSDAKFTDTTYSEAGSSLGLVKSGGDVTISSGVIIVNDDSHNHVISNVDGLQAALDEFVTAEDISDEVDGDSPEINPVVTNRINEVETNLSSQINNITAEDVGARPNTWMPTASDVGAIPIIDAQSNQYDMDVILGSGVHCAFYKTNGDTLNTPYKKGISSVVRNIILSYSFHADWAMQIAFLVGGTTAPFYWRTKTNGTISEWTFGFLPLTGGTLSGQELVLDSGYGRLLVSGNTAQIESRSTRNDMNNRRLFNVSNAVNKPNLADAITVSDFSSGSGKSYKLFGEHNKPSGSYTGNGSSTSRTINVGGIGNVIAIRCGIEGGTIAIVAGSMGVIAKVGNTTKAIADVGGAGNINYSNGVLKITSTDDCLNKNGATYYYQVL